MALLPVWHHHHHHHNHPPAPSTGKLIAAVCHGPAGLLGAVHGGTGQPLLAGRTVACFTAAEEDETGAAGGLCQCRRFKLN
jgi:hypothetical protein